jgi:ketosteroid isomerase-like protein
MMLPAERIRAYFAACGEGAAGEIAAHFTDDAVIYDTNVRPMIGSEAIGRSWVTVRERWQGAVWTVDSVVSEGEAAAIEWSMSGTNPADGRRFVFRGSEHYAFRHTLIAEIRQYWTFDPHTLDTGLIGYRAGDGNS